MWLKENLVANQVWLRECGGPIRCCPGSVGTNHVWLRECGNVIMLLVIVRIVFYISKERIRNVDTAFFFLRSAISFMSLAAFRM